MRRAAGTPTLERGADPAPTKGRSSVGRQRPACARYRARPDARDPGEDVRVVAGADDGAGAGVTAGNDARGESQDEGRRRLLAVRFQHDDGQGGGHG
jgi:hypothetical protein